jgi:hypothetical protein
LKEADKARQMVVDKRCNPPKKNSRILQKFGGGHDDDFREPLPPKKMRNEFHDDNRSVLGEIQNIMEMQP